MARQNKKAIDALGQQGDSTSKSLRAFLNETPNKGFIAGATYNEILKRTMTSQEYEREVMNQPRQPSPRGHKD